MKNRRFGIVDEGILREIERKKEILEKDLDYFLSVGQKRKRSLQVEALKHSASLELEGYTQGMTISQARSARAKEQNRCEDNLLDALNWGMKNYQDELSLDYLRELGKRIDPISNFDGFRKSNVRVTGSRSTLPGAEKLDRELTTFLLITNTLEHPIEKAVYSHLHFVRIHPFADGNGRTTRLLQNIILDKGDYCPIVINRDERAEYLDLVEKATYSYNDQESNADSTFLDSKKIYFDANSPLSMRRLAEKNILETSRTFLKREQSDFFGYLALKIRDEYQRELSKMHKRARK
jgi:Fic family protein